jgi:dipeptidyl aminopeptidase/acylaminoacyl peptidase
VTTYTLADGYRLLAVALDGSQTEQLILGVCAYATWGDAGKDVYAIVYQDDGLALTRIPFDPKTGKTKGQPVTISYDLGYEGQSLSIAGNRMLCTRGTRGSDLWRVEIDPEQNPDTPQMTRLTKSTIHHGSPSISPDGTQIAFNRTDDNRVDIYVMSSRGNENTRVTYTGMMNVSPEWSADGTSLLYLCFENTDAKLGTWSVLNLRDGTVCDYPLHDSLCDLEDATWSWNWAPGEQIVFSGCGKLLFFNPETGDITSHQNLPSDVQLRTAVYAPDGASLGVYWDRDDDSEDGIWIVPLDAESPQFVAHLNAYVIGWGPKGNWIYFWREANTSICEVGRVAIKSGYVQILAALRPGRLPQDNAWLDLSPDATWLVYEVREQQRDLWLVENIYTEL